MRIEFILAFLFLLVPLGISVVGFVGFLAPSLFKSGFNIKANFKKTKVKIEPKPSISTRMFFLLIGIVAFLFFLGILQAIKTIASYPR